jgi:RNA-binding protein Tab2/Atab2
MCRRAVPLATWLSGLEVAFMKCDLKRRELVMECGINTQYLVARVTDTQRAEAQVKTSMS